jgi:hypothetical protein
MALIGVIVLTALLMVLAVALALVGRSDTQLRGAFASGITGFYAAESGLNKGMGEYRNIFLDYNVPHGTDFDPRSLTLGDRSITYKMTERAGNPQNIVIPSGELFAGLNAIQYRYTVNSSATNVRNETEAGVGAEFLVGYIPLLQFVAFYKNDLEIAPGPQMNLQGRVHTNANLYLNADAGPLNIQDNPAVGVLTVQVTAGGKIYRGRKRSSTECTGNVWVTCSRTESGQQPRCKVDLTRHQHAWVPTSELYRWEGGCSPASATSRFPGGIVKPPLAVSAAAQLRRLLGQGRSASSCTCVRAARCAAQALGGPPLPATEAVGRRQDAVRPPPCATFGRGRLEQRQQHVSRTMPIFIPTSH